MACGADDFLVLPFVTIAVLGCSQYEFNSLNSFVTIGIGRVAKSGHGQHSPSPLIGR